MAKDLKVVLFLSRNKDNKHLEGFKGRTKSFLSSRSVGELREEFNIFVNEGVEGEMSRFYHHVNSRDNNKVRKALMHYLLDHEDTNMASIEQRVASLASKKENARESKWLFDFDEDTKKLDEFLEDVNTYSSSETLVADYKTPNGHAVVVSQGFDTRELLAKWSNVELKRDDMLCVDWKVRPHRN